jgi:hypothetical protein
MKNILTVISALLIFTGGVVGQVKGNPVSIRYPQYVLSYLHSPVKQILQVCRSWKQKQKRV